MKWIFLQVVGLAIASLPASAQQPDHAQLAVHYKFTHLRDTTNRQPYRENMVLLVGERSSLYKTNEGPAQQQSGPSPDGRTRMDIRMRGTKVEYYQFPNEKSLVRKDWIPMTDFIISGALPAIDWHITHDTATFGGMHCQKATTHFRGRDYTAWFCPDLPMHVGPWKLNGLPGVIVDARDAKNEVSFAFDGFTRWEPAVIQLPQKGVKTTDKEFSKLEETARKDPEAYSKLMSHNGASGPVMDIKPGSGPVINNPIELPEKK